MIVHFFILQIFRLADVQKRVKVICKRWADDAEAKVTIKKDGILLRYDNLFFSYFHK